jgi:hypothetical protein
MDASTTSNWPLFDASSVQITHSEPCPPLEDLACKRTLNADAVRDNLAFLGALANRNVKVGRLLIEGDRLKPDERYLQAIRRNYWIGSKDGCKPTCEIAARSFLTAINSLPKVSWELAPIKREGVQQHPKPLVVANSKKDDISRAFSGMLRLANHYQVDLARQDKADQLRKVVRAAIRELGDTDRKTRSAESKTRKKRKKKKKQEEAVPKAITAHSLTAPSASEAVSRNARETPSKSPLAAAPKPEVSGHSTKPAETQDVSDVGANETSAPYPPMLGMPFGIHLSPFLTRAEREYP